MHPERIEKLRQEYTDQYVVVDGDRPELARFKGAVGQVRTINFSGRALVQFDWNENRGRYDIEIDYLKVVDKPEPKLAPAKAGPAAAKAAAANGNRQSDSSAPAKAKAAEAEPGSSQEGLREPELSPLERARLARKAGGGKKKPEERQPEPLAPQPKSRPNSALAPLQDESKENLSELERARLEREERPAGSELGSPD